MKKETKLIVASGILLFFLNFFLTPEADFKMSRITCIVFLTVLVLLGAIAFFKWKSPDLTGYCFMTAATFTIIQLTCQLKTR